MEEIGQPNTVSQERRWTPGSFVAAVFALFVVLYSLISSLVTVSYPTDGWLLSGDQNADPPYLVFSQFFLDGGSIIRTGDQLLKVNGIPISQIFDLQEEVLTQKGPDWPDGTTLQYEVLRNGEHVTIDVPIRRISFWKYYAGYFQVDESRSNLVMFLTGIFFFIIGCFVFLLRPSNRAAHALLLLGVGFLPFVVNDSIPTYFYPNLPVSIPFDTWTLVINPSILYLVLAFPYPKLPLRRFPRLSVLMLYLPWPIAFNLAFLLQMHDWRGYQNTAFAIYPVQIFLVMLVTLVALIHSSLTVRDPVGRSQLKWMLVGICSFVFIGVGGWLISSYFFQETIIEGNWLFTAIGWFLMPICLAIAIIRYRLFDIDLIIRRSLQYSVLTGLLALLYYFGTVILQGIFSQITGGSQTPLVVVISTLAIAALFNPLRVRVQNFIDRRFYRQKYNTEKVLSAFSASLRNDVDFDRITETTLSVVEEIMQPRQLSLWLRQTDGRTRTDI